MRHVCGFGKWAYKPFTFRFTPTSPSTSTVNQGFVLVVLQTIYELWGKSRMQLHEVKHIKAFYGPFIGSDLVFVHVLLLPTSIGFDHN